jgi:phenylpyruvate tautomerase PptA (4-oxalocrotonate tautomerase family)
MPIAMKKIQKCLLVTSSVLRIIGSDSDQVEVVQEEVTHDDIPFGWTRTKLEPDW